MNVAFYIFFPGGGIGRYTYELLKSMYTTKQLQPQLICSPDYEWKDYESIDAKPILHSISHKNPVVRKTKFILQQFLNPRLAVKWAKSHNVDILHFADFNHLSFPFWYPALKKTQIKVTVSAHDIKRQKSIVNRPWEDRQLKNFYEAVDGLFVHSEYQKSELLDFTNVSPDKVYVVPHGMYSYPTTDKSQTELKNKWDIPNSAQVALFFGQLRDEKNLNSFIKAMPRCAEDIYLIVAGRGGGRHYNPEYYEKLVRELRLTDRVRFLLRYIEDEEVAELFTLSDWVALPYKKLFTSQSGVLNVAAYYKKPVLVGPAPVLQETVLNYDIGVTCAGESEIYLEKSINNIYRRLKYGPQFNYSPYQEHFTWRENANRTINVYESNIKQLHHSFSL